MGQYQVLAAVPVRSGDTETLKALRARAQGLLCEEADPAEWVESVRLAEDGWLEAHWYVEMSSDERSGLWALRRLRGALVAARNGLCRGNCADWIEVGDGFAVSVEPVEAARNADG